MDYEEIVRVLSDFLEGGAEQFQEENGAKARSGIEGIIDVFDELLYEETPFGSLWIDYKKNPRENEAEMIGALEAVEEVMPEIPERIRAFYSDYTIPLEDINPKQSQGQPEIDALQGSVPELDERQGTTEFYAEEASEWGEEERANYADDREVDGSEDEIDEGNLRYPVWPDYIDEANTYYIGDRGDDQSTSATMFFDPEGADKADYSALSEDEIDDYGDEDVDAKDNDDPDQIAG